MHVHEPNSENIFEARAKRECSFLSNAPPIPVIRSTVSLEACYVLPACPSKESITNTEMVNTGGITLKGEN